MKSVRLSSEFVRLAKTYAGANYRSVPKQIEHWARIGRIMEDNPSMTLADFKEAMVKEAEIYMSRKTK